MKSKRNNLCRISGSHVFLLGSLLGFLSLCPAILPYGFRYVTRGDFIEQQLPFILETRRILRTGASFSFSTFLGAPSIGSYSFYTMGSPFVWPLALLPVEAVPYGIAVMAALKLAFSLLIAFCWLRRLFQDDRVALFSAVLYAFSSFTIINTQFYHFWEVIAFFPLILLGMEDAMSRNPRLLPLALYCGLNTLTNYYFMLSSAMLAALYFLFRLFSEDWAHARTLRRVFAVLLYCGLGCALAGFLLLPALRFMMQITRTGSRDISTLLRAYSPAILLERLRSLLMPIESGVVHAWIGDATSWSSTASYLPVFGMTGILVFFAHPKKQRWLRHLLLLLFVFSCIPFFSGSFALWTNSGYTRWWYGLSAFQAAATGYALTEDETNSFCLFAPESRTLWMRSFFACSAVVFFIILPGLMPESFLGQLPVSLSRILLNRRTGSYAAPAFRVFSLVLSITGGAILLILLRIHSSMPNTATGSGYRVALSCICLFACLSSASYIWIGDHLILSGGERPGEGKYTLSELAEPTLSSLALPEETEYKRIDYGLRLRNYGLLRGYSSLTCFQSLRSSTIGRFITAAGFGYDESTTVTPSDASGALRAFLSVSEYHQTDPDDFIPEGFVYDREENGFPVYRNQNVIPMGFLMTTALPESRARLSRKAIADTLLTTAVLRNEDWERLSAQLSEGNPPDARTWQEKAQALRESVSSSFQTAPSGFTIQAAAETPGLLVITIPYDKGFTATVDGKPSKIIPCDLSFMSVYIEKGTHEITFTYHTRGLREGIILSLSAGFVLILLSLCRKKAKTIHIPPDERGENQT